MDAFAHAYCERPADDVCAHAASVRLLALDVDGVLTDGGIYIGGNGEPFKRFHIHDGKGLAMLRQAGITTAILTARRSSAVSERARELGIEHVHQGTADKANALQALANELEIDLTATAYIGDDLVDMGAVGIAGFGVCVADGHPRLQHKAHWVTCRRGGHGAVRELCELLLAARGRLQTELERYD